MIALHKALAWRNGSRCSRCRGGVPLVLVGGCPQKVLGVAGLRVGSRYPIDR